MSSVIVGFAEDRLSTRILTRCGFVWQVVMQTWQKPFWRPANAVGWLTTGMLGIEWVDSLIAFTDFRDDDPPFRVVEPFRCGVLSTLAFSFDARPGRDCQMIDGSIHTLPNPGGVTSVPDGDWPIRTIVPTMVDIRPRGWMPIG